MHFLIAATLAIALGGLHISDDVSPFNQMRLMELALLLLLCIVLLRKSDVLSYTLTHRRTILLASIFFGLGTITAATSLWPDIAFMEIGHGILIATAIYTLANAIRVNPQAIRLILIGMVVGCGVAGSRFLVQVALTIVTGVREPLLGWYAPYSNPRFYAQAVVWVLPLLAVIPPTALTDIRSRWISHALRATSLVTWTLLIWSGSRGALLGLSVGCFCIWGLSATGNRWTLLKPLLRNALLGLAGWIAVSSLVGWDFSDRYRSLSLARFGFSGRDLLVRRSWELIQQHPFLGIGPGQFSAYQNLLGHAESHPHNLILQLAVEWGIPACVIFLFLMCHLFGSLLRSIQSKKPDPITHALVLSLIASCVLCMIDGPQIMPISLICTIVGVGLLCARITPEASATPMAFTVKVYLGIIVVASWGLLLQGIFRHPACASYPAGLEDALPYGPGYDNPRFWVQGRLPMDAQCIELGRYAGSMDRLYQQRLDQQTWP